MKMVWKADTNHSYASPPYRLCWTIRGWTVWNYKRQDACLGRDLTISRAMQVAEDDRALQAQEG